MNATQLNTKQEIRWELAHISNKLNALLREHMRSGNRLSTELNIHNLRAERDKLLSKLSQLEK